MLARLHGACAVVALLLTLPAAAAAQQAAATAPRPDKIRMFLDCSFFCDENFLKQEITWVDYMRDRRDADVHVLVTTQDTGGGGTEYTIKFIGLGPFAGVEQTLRYSAPQTATADERRKAIAEVLKRGLVRYVSESSLASRLRITLAEQTGAAKGAVPQKDPWNLWVFRANVGGSFNGEQSTKSQSLRGSLSANRTTDAWKLTFSASAGYSDNSYQLSDTETFKSVTRNIETDALAVKSLTQHWSLGLVGTTQSSTFLNYDLRVRIAPGIEYNFFPYSQSTRRMLTLNYTVGFDSNDYREITIYEKTEEKLLDHRFETSLSLRQPWGTASASVNVLQYLSNPSKYSISAFGGTNVRLFKGFSFNVFTDLSRTRDQIYLPRGEATPEEILVRQRQLATGYQYFINFGITYSFGSIFNNIVNPRFGGGGGNIFFFD
jgi:Protein of unknown function, DUF481